LEVVMTSHKRAFVVVTVLLLGASVGHAQGVQRSSDLPGFYQDTTGLTHGYSHGAVVPAGPLLVVCWAEVPSSRTAYFSDTFASHAPLKSRKAFRELVAMRYGPVSRAGCAGNNSSEKLEKLVQQWKDGARATSSAIVDTGWEL
jgi:hypothetical protein